MIASGHIWRSGSALVALGEGPPGAARALLRELATAALGLPEGDVSVEHETGCAPRLVRPPGARLHLSCASRGRAAAAAVAPVPVGVDVELVEPDGAVPWNVLHPGEAAFLNALPLAELPAAFARLWSLKEAYGKALRLGLSRDPASFRVELGDGDAARVLDPSAGADPCAETAWTRIGGQRFAVAVVTLPAAEPSP